MLTYLCCAHSTAPPRGSWKHCYNESRSSVYVLSGVIRLWCIVYTSSAHRLPTFHCAGLAIWHQQGLECMAPSGPLIVLLAIHKCGSRLALLRSQLLWMQTINSDSRACLLGIDGSCYESWTLVHSEYVCTSWYAQSAIVVWAQLLPIIPNSHWLTQSAGIRMFPVEQLKGWLL